MIYCIIWANKERIIFANIISFWLNNNSKVVKQWLWGRCPNGWVLGVRYWVPLLQECDLPGKVEGEVTRVPRRLCLTSKGTMEKITSVKDLISVDYKDSNRSSASVCYGGLAGMLVATVKWAGISIRKDQTAYALEILERATAEREKVNNVVERYNRRFNH